MKQSRKRDWTERDFIKQAKERGYLPDIGANLYIQPNIPETETKDPTYERGFYVGSFSEKSLAELKLSAYDEMLYQQWQDFQKKLENPEFVQAIDGRPQASYGMQDAFSEVMKMAELNFPVVILPWDDQASFQEYASLFYEQDPVDLLLGKPNIDNYKRDFVWTTYAIMKGYNHYITDLHRERNEDGSFVTETQPVQYDADGKPLYNDGRWLDRLIDSTKETYPDNTPCLIIFTRKVVYGGSIFFVKDVEQPELANTTAPLVVIGTAGDFYDVDPRVAGLIDNNELRILDGWLGITIQQSALRDIIEGIIDIYDPPGAGGGDPGDPFGPGDGGEGGGQPPPIDPNDPPPGVTPPGGGGGTGSPPPPEGIIGDRATFDCATEILFEHEGTNHTYALIDFSYSQNAAWFFLGLQNFTPVNAQNVEADIFAAIATAVEAWRVANSKPATYQIKRVVLCFTYQRMRRVALLADGEETFITLDLDRFTGNPISGFADPKPRLTVARGTANSNKYPRGEIKRLGTWEYVVNGVSMQAVADVEIAEQVHSTITNYQTVTGLVFRMIDVPATWQFFASHTDIPIVKIGLESADIYYATSKWTGHFNLSSIVYHENPNVPGQNVWFSDVPDGIISGMASQQNIALYTGTESAGHGSVVLVDPAHPQFLMGIADGYSPYPDGSYTTATLTLKCAGGAQTIFININTAGGGPGTNFTASYAGNGFTGPPYVYFPVENTFTFDISSLGLTSATTLYRIGLGVEGMYLWEWSLTLS